jgi:hypothetical protein
VTAAIKPKTTRPQVGDIALVPSAGAFGSPFFRIDGVELDAAGEVSGYFLASPESRNRGQFVAAARVSAVFSNVLNPSQE